MQNRNPAKEARKTGTPLLRKSQHTAGGLRWEGVLLKEYKETGEHFKKITRQVLFGEGDGLTNEVRYFELLPGGHSTFERHEHVHAVIVIHGSGRVVTAEMINPISAFDLVHIPPMTWHQFHADVATPLGFLCLVPCERDRPVRPTEKEIAALRLHPKVGNYIRT